MLLCRILVLIFATTQPSTQDSSSTNTDTSSVSTTPPMTAPAPGATVRYTTTAGTITTALNIRPIRYTPVSRATRIFPTGTGRDSSRSLSLALYRLE